MKFTLKCSWTFILPWSWCIKHVKANLNSQPVKLISSLSLLTTTALARIWSLSFCFRCAGVVVIPQRQQGHLQTGRSGAAEAASGDEANQEHGHQVRQRHRLNNLGRRRRARRGFDFCFVCQLRCESLSFVKIVSDSTLILRLQNCCIWDRFGTVFHFKAYLEGQWSYPKIACWV